MDNNPNMSEDEARNVEEAKRDVEALLAFLWTSAKGVFTAMRLADIPESPQLNHQCKLLCQKGRGGRHRSNDGRDNQSPDSTYKRGGSPKRGSAIPNDGHERQ
jgi:hypothetical protein